MRSLCEYVRACVRVCCCVRVRFVRLSVHVSGESVCVSSRSYASCACVSALLREFSSMSVSVHVIDFVCTRPGRKGEEWGCGGARERGAGVARCSDGVRERERIRKRAQSPIDAKGWRESSPLLTLLEESKGESAVAYPRARHNAWRVSLRQHCPQRARRPRAARG